MTRDPSVFIMGEDIVGAAGRPEFWEDLGGAYGGNRGLIIDFGPERVIDMPVAEMAFSGAGVGAAMAGARPIVDIMFIDLIGCLLRPARQSGAQDSLHDGRRLRLPRGFQDLVRRARHSRTAQGAAAPACIIPKPCIRSWRTFRA